jgi:pyruvate kinase
VPIVALSSDHRALRRMALHFGVVPQEMAACEDVAALVRAADDLVRQRRYANPGDRMVVVAGSSMGTPGMLNGVLIHTVGKARPEHLSEGADAMVQPAEGA